jgi:hypothetical protein
MAASQGRWHQRIAVNVGGMTTGLVRLGTRLFKTPQEVQAGIGAVQAAEVGVYKQSESPCTRGYGSALAAMDKKMRNRGWERLVGVYKDNDLVVSICFGLRDFPRNGSSVASW